MGQRCNITDPELAFVVGLVKDIGLLILVEHAPEELRAVIALAREYRMGLVKATHKILDTDHIEIGSWLAENWGLDQRLSMGLNISRILPKPLIHRWPQSVIWQSIFAH